MSGADLPYAADASEPLGEAELQVLREQFAKEKEAGYPSVQTRFNLAWCVVSKPAHALIAQGSGQSGGQRRRVRGHRHADGHLPRRGVETARVSVLPRARALQDRQLR